jgi:hypothetical protein
VKLRTPTSLFQIYLFQFNEVKFWFKEVIFQFKEVILWFNEVIFQFCAVIFRFRKVIFWILSGLPNLLCSSLRPKYFQVGGNDCTGQLVCPGLEQQCGQTTQVG